MPLTIVELAIISVFILAVFSLYTVIQAKQNLATFVLVPVIIICGLLGGSAIYSLRGTAIEAMPEGIVDVLVVEIKKPDILLIVKHKGDDEELFYKIPYSKENAREMQGIKTRQKMGMQSEGEFSQVKPKDGTKKSTAKIKFKSVPPNEAPPKQQDSSIN